VVLYVKIVVDKKYNTLAYLLGGMRDSTWERTHYDAAKPWWNNALVGYAEPPIRNADVIGRDDAQLMTGHGASGNVTVHSTLVPHADVAVKTIPASDAIRGTLTTTISTAAEYYDEHWTQMAHETDRKVTFRFDTCDPNRPVEVVGHETRPIPAFALERYTRDEKRWEPKSSWPGDGAAESGDWRVVIYGKDARLEITSYRYVPASVAGAQR
jgi:hypothetical protein